MNLLKYSDDFSSVFIVELEAAGVHQELETPEVPTMCICSGLDVDTMPCTFSKGFAPELTILLATRDAGTEKTDAFKVFSVEYSGGPLLLHRLDKPFSESKVTKNKP